MRITRVVFSAIASLEDAEVLLIYVGVGVEACVTAVAVVRNGRPAEACLEVLEVQAVHIPGSMLC